MNVRTGGVEKVACKMSIVKPAEDPPRERSATRKDTTHARENSITVCVFAGEEGPRRRKYDINLVEVGLPRHEARQMRLVR